MNLTSLILVADGGRARLVSIEDPLPTGRGWRLVERLTLINPEHQQPLHERLTGSRAESRGHVPGHWYGLDDHRLRREDAQERRFASAVVGEVLRRTRGSAGRRLLLIASPRMLGHLRSPRLLQRFEVEARANDVSKLTLGRLHAYLEGRRLLPTTPPALEAVS